MGSLRHNEQTKVCDDQTDKEETIDTEPATYVDQVVPVARRIYFADYHINTLKSKLPDDLKGECADFYNFIISRLIGKIFNHKDY